MPILALLKLIPLKDVLWAAALIGAVWFVYHRGELRIEHKDAALKAAAVALNKASENLADIKELNVGKVYEKYIALPPVRNAGLVCHAPAAVKSQAPAGGPEAAGSTSSRADNVFDPSGALLTDSRDADAQINGLIDTVLILEAELEGRH